jgi:HEPN domain-containing protein
VPPTDFLLSAGNPNYGATMTPRSHRQWRDTRCSGGSSSALQLPTGEEDAVVDIDHQVTYWRDGAREEWQVAEELLERGRVRHALFFTHLAIEKALKARVCRQTMDLAPRTHNLVRLAEVARLSPGPERLRVLSRLNDFSQAGRYPETTGPMLTPDQARRHVTDASEVFQWLMTE